MEKFNLSGSISRIQGASDASGSVLEKDHLIKERHWFVNSELVNALLDVEKLLLDAESTLGKNDNPSNRNKEDNTSLPSEVITFDNNDNIKGSFRIEGHYIAEADITVKTAKWNKGAPFKYSISNQNPFKLNQIQNSLNYLKQSINIIKQLIVYNNSNNNSVSISSKEENSKLKHILNGIEQMTNYLKLSIEDCLHAPSYIFPKRVQQPMIVFHPPLPSDLIVEFNIQNEQLLLCMYILHKTQGAISTPLNNTLLNMLPKESIIGQKFQSGTSSLNGIVEILDCAIISSNINLITNTISKLTITIQQLQDLRDKLLLFTSI